MLSIVTSCLNVFFSFQGSRDVMGFIAPFERASMSFKSFPSLDLIGTEKACKLAESLIEHGLLNAVSPIKKLESALLASHHKQRINLSNKSDVDMAWQVGLCIRILLSKYRWLLDHEDVMRTCCARVPLGTYIFTFT